MPRHFMFSIPLQFSNIFCIIVYIYIYIYCFLFCFFILINLTSYFMTGPLYCNAEKQFAEIVAQNRTTGF